MDPLAENHSELSFYAICNNNPIINIDPDGRDWYQAENGNAIWRRSSDKTYTDENGVVYNNIGQQYISANGTKITLFQQKTNDEGGMYLTSTTFDTKGKLSTDKVLDVLALQNSDKSREAVMKFWANPTFWNEIKYLSNEVTSQYTNPFLIVGGVTVGVIGLSSSGLRTTLHGAERVAGSSATRAGVLSLQEIGITKSLGRSFKQVDGATVYLHEISPGRFNAVVEGNRGVITTMKNWSQNSINRIGKNYGWSK